jgi:ADP-ribose pyrophosphatase YjhB (NUDIX family)
MNFCSHCGSGVRLQIPRGDDRPRYVCSTCGAIHYQNPKVVVGCIATWEAKILLCRRSIEPRYGTWTIPAGYLENGETVAQGAQREVLEEARAEVRQMELFGLYNICHVSQIYLIFRGRMIDESYAAGDESLEARLVEPADIPWDDLAFPVIEQTLQRYVEARRRGDFKFHIEDVVRRMKRDPQP